MNTPTTPDQLMSLVMMHGNGKRVGDMDVDHSLRLGDITVTAYSVRLERLSSEFKNKQLTIKNGPLVATFAPGETIPSSMVVMDGESKIPVLGESGPWNDALRITMNELDAWALPHPAKDKDCKSIHAAVFRRAESVFDEQSLAPLSESFSRVNAQLNQDIMNMIQRDDGRTDLHIDDIAITYTQVLSEYLTISSPHISVNYYASQRCINSTKSEHWQLESFTVAGIRDDIDVRDISGPWDNYLESVFKSIQTWIDAQISQADYLALQHKKALKHAASLIPDHLRVAVIEQAADVVSSEKIIKELDRFDSLTETIIKQEVSEINSESEPAEGDDNGRDILTQRDFLMQRLSVEKPPAPSGAIAHSKRGRLRVKISGKG